MGTPVIDEATAHARLREFAATLSPDELSALFARTRSRRQAVLIQRARAAVDGAAS